MQSVFFAFLFMTKKHKELPDKILVVWLFILAIHTGLILVNLAAASISIPKNFSILFTLLYGPALFLYVSKLSRAGSVLRTTDGLHLLPFLLFLLLSFVISGIDNLFTKGLSAICGLSGPAYCFATYFLLQKHTKNITNRFSNLGDISLKWVRTLVVGLLIIWLGAAILVFLHRFLQIELSLQWFFIVIPFFIFYMGYHGIKQKIIYTRIEQPPDELPAQPLKNQKSYEDSYKRSGLQPESMEAIHKKLLNSMQHDQLYLNPTLSLQELSETLKLPSHHITQTLNEFAKVSFYDFVNQFRVDDCKNKIDSGEADKYSLIGIAYECGFNSKSSFNRIFKNHTGQSPSEYRNSKLIH
jgi:AraC-like DNA-binding protein